MLTRKKFLELTSKYSLATLLLQQSTLRLFAGSRDQVSTPGLSLPPSANPPQTFNWDSIPDYLLIENHQDGNLLILAYDLAIDASLTLPSGRTVSIYAYRSAINRAVTVPGKNVYLFTRHLRSDANAVIDTSGAPGRDFVQDSKPSLQGCSLDRGNSKAPAADNISIEHIQLDDPNNQGVMNGTAAGNVWVNAGEIVGDLAIKADGGTGGHGENGKAGLYGCFLGGQAHPDHNPAGYPRMSGGDGALGGYGGPGGAITLAYPGNQTGAIHTSNAGGRQGDSGIGGKGGGGGTRTIFIGMVNR